MSTNDSRARWEGKAFPDGIPDEATASDVPLDPLAPPREGDEAYHDEKLGYPGEAPFTRGPYPSMYRGRPWTMRQYAGFGTAHETNARYRYLLERGQTGLSVAFDLPTQMGYDSDHMMSDGEVGKVGVAIDTLEDMEVLFDGIPLGDVSTSMTINATAPILVSLYAAVARKQGVPLDQLKGTVQNDILKEYAARGCFIYPAEPSMRIAVDLFEFCTKEMPKWNFISVSGYHMREAGCTAAQEIAFTLSNGLAYLQAAVDRGLDATAIARRISFFFGCHNRFIEEVGKFRAARRMWADLLSERFGITDDRARLLRFHTQTCGCTLTAQQPENNIVRVAYQALAAVLGGTQSLHTNSMDEALGLPTDKSAGIALRTQQILAYETGVTDAIDPFGGSYEIERMTDALEEKARGYIAQVDQVGGGVKAVEEGLYQREIEKAAYAYQKDVEAEREVVVGVNRFVNENETPPEILKVDPTLQAAQVERLQSVRASRDAGRVDELLARLGEAATGSENLVPLILDAVESNATLGEISDALRAVYGNYVQKVR